MMMKLNSLILFTLLFILSACHFGSGEKIKGNGQIVTQEKNLTGFNRVQVSGSMNVHLLQQANGMVKITADENLMPFIEVSTNGDKLIVREKKGYNLDPSSDIIIYAAAPAFEEITVSGSGDIISDNTLSGDEGLELKVSGSGNVQMKVDMPKLKTSVSGSGSVVLMGEAEDLDISISGSGDVRCFDLTSDNVEIAVSGSSNAEVTALKKLDAKVSGSGTVQYKGNPTISTKVSGSGEVKKAG